MSIINRFSPVMPSLPAEVRFGAKKSPTTSTDRPSVPSSSRLITGAPAHASRFTDPDLMVRHLYNTVRDEILKLKPASPPETAMGLAHQLKETLQLALLQEQPLEEPQMVKALLVDKLYQQFKPAVLNITPEDLQAQPLDAQLQLIQTLKALTFLYHHYQVEAPVELPQPSRLDDIRLPANLDLSQFNPDQLTETLQTLALQESNGLVIMLEKLYAAFKATVFNPQTGQLKDATSSETRNKTLQGLRDLTLLGKRLNQSLEASPPSIPVLDHQA